MDLLTYLAEAPPVEMQVRREDHAGTKHVWLKWDRSGYVLALTDDRPFLPGRGLGTPRVVLAAVGTNAWEMGCRPSGREGLLTYLDESDRRQRARSPQFTLWKALNLGFFLPPRTVVVSNGLWQYRVTNMFGSTPSEIFGAGAVVLGERGRPARMSMTVGGGAQQATTHTLEYRYDEPGCATPPWCPTSVRLYGGIELSNRLLMTLQVLSLRLLDGPIGSADLQPSNYVSTSTTLSTYVRSNGVSYLVRDEGLIRQDALDRQLRQSRRGPRVLYLWAAGLTLLLPIAAAVRWVYRTQYKQPKQIDQASL